MSTRNMLSTADIVFSPQGIPKWTKATMPEKWAKVLESEGRVKPWRICHNCTATPASVGRNSLFRCGGCVNIRCTEPARYCSRKCQREAWKYHKEECERDLESERRTEAEYPSWMVPTILKSQRQARRWTHALAQDVMAWVVRQAYASNPTIETRYTIFHVKMNKLIPNEAQSPVWPVSFEFEDWYPDPDDEADYLNREDGSMVYYRLTINHKAMHEGYVNVNDTKDDTLNAPLPQWPWVLGQVSLMGDILPEIATIRLYTLVSTVRTLLYNGKKYMDKFQMPKPFKRFEMTEESLDEWLNLMYPAVACIGSKFYPPIKVMDYKFGHLLRQCTLKST